MKLVPLAFALALWGCAREPSRQPPASTAARVAPPEGARWLLEGTTDERFARTAAHLRGFDVAMVETGHRYAELYWAGRDRNWDYAAYQAEKIETAIARGVERRPRRAASAQMLVGPMESLRRAVRARDAAAFDAAFATLTASCNACHRAERVAFVRVAAPTVRSGVVQAPLEPAP